MTDPAATDSPAYDAPALLVVTDLDGTLLDHFSYSFEPAREALELLKKLGIPLIPNTSKTSAELGPLRRQLAVNDPFIVENGSAIFLPRDTFPQPPGGVAFNKDYYLVELGLGYEEILNRLEPLRERYTFQGFSDLTDIELEQLTGLESEQVALARRRRFSEPVVWQDSDSARDGFLAELDGMGLHTLQGGRFLHVLGKADKGAALYSLRKLYQQTFSRQFTVIALGDSGNDVAMLEAADWPVIIRSPSHEPPQLRSDKPVTLSDHNGPEGWNSCVLKLVANYLSDNGRT